MLVTRRNVLGGCILGAALPATACRAAPAGPVFRPEAYGAAGDGNRDDYDAFHRLASAVNAARGGTVVLSPGRTYYLDRFITASNGVTAVSFTGCEALTIDGFGATISVKGDFNRSEKGTRGLPGLRLENCRQVVIRNLQLVGNVDRMTRSPSLTEAATHGLLFAGCTDVLIDAVIARHFAADGLYIGGGSANPGRTSQASRNFTVRNSRFLYNARQGLSIIQLRGGTFDNCDFSHTGYVAPGVRGPYGSHPPGAGVDIEPNRSPSTQQPVDVLTGEIQFQGCRMIGNRGTSLVACKYSRRAGRFLEKVTVRSCELACDAAGLSRYGFIFDVPGGEVTNCTLDMGDRTAFVGWYQISDADPRFVGNTVQGRDPRPARPLLVVRQTLGRPVIERNRFIVPRGQARGIVVNNPNAIVRENEILNAS